MINEISQIPEGVEDNYLKRWGENLFRIAKEIYYREYARKSQIIEIMNELYDVNQTSHDKLLLNARNPLEAITFSAAIIKGIWFPGPTDIKDYWLMNIFQYSPIYIEEPIKRIISIVDSYNSKHLMKKYSSSDFTSEGRFKLTFPVDSDRSLTLTAPFTLHKLNIDFAIKVIETITTSKVGRIAMWYAKNYEQVGSIEREIEISINEKKDDTLPSLTKAEFQSLYVSDMDNWYKGIPEFDDYIRKKK